MPVSAFGIHWQFQQAAEGIADTHPENKNQLCVLCPTSNEDTAGNFHSGEEGERKEPAYESNILQGKKAVKLRSPYFNPNKTQVVFFLWSILPGSLQLKYMSPFSFQQRTAKEKGGEVEIE